MEAQSEAEDGWEWGRGHALCDLTCGAGRGQAVKQKMSRREGSSVPGLRFQTSLGL